MTESRLMLLDTASLYFRAFHGLPDTLRSPDGRPVNAVRGLLDFIARLVTDHRPTHLACCWDDDWRPAWRVALLDSYKTHRVAAVADGAAVEEAPDELAPQVPMIRAVLDALGLPIVGVADHEADDVIGSLARQVSATGAAAVDVVTGDRDLFQLVDDAARVRVIYVGRGISKAESVDQAWVRQAYGIEAGAYVDFSVLRGDPSDGIPGVPGIGVKTAAKLLTEHGSLDGILAAGSKPDGGVAAGVRSKLHAAIDYLAVAPQVVSVVDDLDVPELGELVLPSAPVDDSRFNELASEYGLGGSADRVRKALFVNH
ncbi:5'-3' exonuclease [Enemella sp. A6]|uniref:5'-3' exonuclease n=1 Tax=Enemella sp. A6 TaxID=3440152 RepID=UPI003EB8EA76